MRQVAIKRANDSVPGGMMAVPLPLGAAINTLIPGARVRSSA